MQCVYMQMCTVCIYAYMFVFTHRNTWTYINTFRWVIMNGSVMVVWSKYKKLLLTHLKNDILKNSSPKIWKAHKKMKGTQKIHVIVKS
jgi:DMSO reductase anchor subunit